MFVDTHTHFYDEWLLPDAEAAVKRALEAGVGKMIQADIDSRERPDMWAIGNRHPGVLFQMLGVYPGSLNAENWQDELDQVHRIAAMGYYLPQQVGALDQVQGKFGRGFISGPGLGPASVPRSALEARSGGPGPGARIKPRPKSGWTRSTGGADTTQDRERTLSSFGQFVAIGEVGLDYHEGKEFAGIQKEALRVQLELASARNLPVNIHLRDAWEDFFKVLEDCRHLHLRGNLHCFSGSYEAYERANRSGEWSVGIGGVITFKNNKLVQTVERIPMERILLETDAPYLAPTPHRGERNESAYLPLVAAKVAEVKGISLEECERITTRNAETLFCI